MASPHIFALTGFDYLALVILVGSLLLGMWRGFLREVFALLGWIVAFFVARALGPRIAPHLPADLPGQAATQAILAFVLVFVVVVFLAGILNALLGKVADLSGLRPADRGLGMLFGIARGVLILMVLVVAGRMTELPQQPFWQNSVLRPYVEQGIVALRPFLPPALDQYVQDS